MRRVFKKPLLFGPLSALGLGIAAAVCLVDQASKFWLIDSFDIVAKQPVAIGPYVEIVLIWNKGISYGLFQQNSLMGQWALFTFKIVAVVALTVWLARVGGRIGAMALGLIIGGAVGNAIDQLTFGAVADFVHFHVGEFSWYVFNLADVAIVAGVALLLYEALLGNGRTGAAR